MPRLRLNYKQCVEMALQNNNLVQAARYKVLESKAKEKEAHPRGIPVIKYQHRIAPIPQDIDNAASSFFSGDIAVFNNFKLELGSPITTFGKLETAQDLAQLGIDASWFEQVKETDEMASKIYQIYQGLLLARELQALAGKAYDAIDGKINELEKERVIDQIAILKLKVALYEVEKKVEEAKKKEALGLYALKLQLGLEQDADFDIAGFSLLTVAYHLQPFDYYLERARTSMPEYRLLETAIKAKEQQLKLEKLNYAPNLGVGAFFDIGRSPGVTGDEDESTFTNPFNFTKAGIGMELKGTLDFVQTGSKIRQTRAGLLGAIYKKRAAVHGLELELRKNHLEVLEAQGLKDRAAREKTAARQLVFLTKSNLDIGLGEKKDYLDALQSYLLFQGREYEAIFNYNVAVHNLKRRIGDLYEGQEKENP